MLQPLKIGDGVLSPGILPGAALSTVRVWRRLTRLGGTERHEWSIVMTEDG